jgi:hypothetical protein
MSGAEGQNGDGGDVFVVRGCVRGNLRRVDSKVKADEKENAYEVEWKSLVLLE